MIEKELPREILVEAVNLYWGTPMKLHHAAAKLGVVASTLWKNLDEKGVPLRRSGVEPYVDHRKRRIGLQKVDPQYRPLTVQQKRVLKTLLDGRVYTRESLRDTAHVASASSRVSELCREHGMDKAIEKGWKEVGENEIKVRTYHLVDLDAAQNLLARDESLTTSSAGVACKGALAGFQGVLL